jgi:hypothetical protein
MVDLYTPTKGFVREQGEVFGFFSPRERIRAGAESIHVVLNHNITIAADFEKAFNPQDGTPLGVYIGSYFIF